MTINLVQGDTGPQIKATLTRADTGSAEDLTGATIKLHFKKRRTTTVLFSLDNVAGDDDLDDGIALFNFSGTQLDIDEGYYTGEIEVVFASGKRETVFDELEFFLRADYA